MSLKKKQIEYNDIIADIKDQIRRRGASIADAEDATQHGMLQALMNVESDSERVFKYYALQGAWHYYLKIYRRQIRITEMKEMRTEAFEYELPRPDMRLKRIKEAISQMNEAYQTLLEMSFQGYSQKEISQQTGISYNAVRVRKHQLLKKLRHAV